MSNTDQIVRSALGSLNSDASYLIACSWANERYSNIVSRVRFKHLRRVGEFVAPGIVSTGTVSITQGSQVVVGSSTTWTALLVGRHFRGANSWYRIASVPSPTELHLESSYTENTLTASSYTIAARFIDLGERARWLGNTLVMGRTRYLINASPLESLDWQYPGRIIPSSSRPEAWAEIGSVVNSNGQRVKQIEIYPPLTNAELFYYLYWELPTDISDPKSLIPPEIDLFILKEGVLIDVMRSKMAKALDEGKPEIAATWGNHFRAQSTAWETEVRKAIQADKGVEDSTFILQSMTRRVVGDITTARDDVWSRGNWP